ncbi:TniB family NTP-binding protein [Xanthomonas campestris pv. zingibericola]|uniref:AAA family ATPase n=1 Tax=Xanthomonas euvesicatoria TaxID=456327 RepID=UPI001C48605D|nr:AAA family ATPase [Xanthomonas euvesicatoria]MBV6859649.1 TniB family NTP-binding protein [Xanthomonas campestris pv. zingibericola]
MTRKLSPAALHRLTIPHPRYQEVERRLFTQLSMGAPGSVVLLVGPTRVGKSRLVRDVSERLVKHPSSDDAQPIIVVEAATTNGGRFSMKHFTIRALQALRHPMFGELGFVIRQSESETHLRIRLEQAILHRQTRYLFIDEAHHLLRTSRSGLAGEVLDSLKCLANATGVILLLAGGYELFTAGLSSPHLNGRMRVIEFARYRDDGLDEVSFLGIFKGLDECLPWRKGQSLVAHSAYMKAGTLGCLGLLLAWINAAMCEMACRGEQLLGLEHFTETRFEEQISLIAREIATGENAMQRLLPAKLSTQGAPASPHPDPARRKPFQRAPKRDRVIPTIR